MLVGFGTAAGITVAVGLVLRVYADGHFAEATVAAGTILLALATFWLAIETREERRELREQHSAALAAAREGAREAETRAWAVELRKRLSFARVATLRLANRMVIVESTPFNDTQAKEFLSGSWRSWTEDWSSIQADLFAYMDLAGVFTDDERKKAATALTNLQDAGKGTIAKHVRQNADKFVESIDELNVLIDKRFGIKSTLSQKAGPQ